MSRVGIVVVTHGEAGADMVDAAERLVGALTDVRSVVVMPGDQRAEVERRIDAVVLELKADDILFLVDLEGSTPFNLCCKSCGGTSVVLTGMNMPMLFKLATANRSVGAVALAEELRNTGLKSIHIRAGGPPR